MARVGRVIFAAAVTLGLGGCEAVLGLGSLHARDGGAGDSGDASADAEPPPYTIDKVDLLFAIDNSPSMADKQALFAASVPALINRLLNPNCVSPLTCSTPADCTGLAGAQCDIGYGGVGQCFVRGDGSGVNQCKSFPNTRAEFQPVHDLHIGIVSSSLGAVGSPDVCVPANPDTTHQNDEGHLLNRTVMSVGPPVVEGTIPDAKPLDGNGGNFLAWLPASNPKNQGQSPPNVPIYNDGQQSQLVSDFQSLVNGVQSHGCALPGQLESWYRFLIQPDPWTQATTTQTKTTLSGIDSTLLKMRHDFLRPDSLVAVIQVSDKEDSWIDPIAIGGQAWAFRTKNFPGGVGGGGAAPRETSACDHAGPTDPNCSSCAFSNNASDPNCTSCAGGTSGCPQMGWYTPAGPSVPIAAADGLTVHFGRQLMKRRYGVDPQPDYHRYVTGLSSNMVPDSAHEHDANGNYAPNPNCVNPLYAAALPDGSNTSPSALCQLMPGPRRSDMVFYAILGGVPNELIADANGNPKLSLAQKDWTAILGQNPDGYDLSGIDPHMIESVSPRQGLVAPGTSYNLGTDPINGREWNTVTSPSNIDFEYACTFTLPTPKDCTAMANAGSCDCTGTGSTAVDAPPLCSTTTRTTQILAKVYPQSRYQLVAKGLGSQALVASLCAKDTNPSDLALPTYGYVPALRALVAILKTPICNAECGQRFTP